MEKSRSWPSYPEIIDRSDLKSSSRRILESFITVAFWSGFVYLLVPIVTLCLWVFGVQIAYVQLIESQGLTELIRIIKGSGIMVFSITLMILGWGYYNYLLFRIRGERRNSQVLICYDEDFADLYDLDLQTLQTAKEQNRLLVTLTDSRIKVQPAPYSSGLTVVPDEAAMAPLALSHEPEPISLEDLSGTWSNLTKKKTRGMK